MLIGLGGASLIKGSGRTTSTAQQCWQQCSRNYQASGSSEPVFHALIPLALRYEKVATRAGSGNLITNTVSSNQQLGDGTFVGECRFCPPDHRTVAFLRRNGR